MGISRTYFVVLGVHYSDEMNQPKLPWRLGINVSDRDIVSTLMIQPCCDVFS